MGVTGVMVGTTIVVGVGVRMMMGVHVGGNGIGVRVGKTGVKVKVKVGNSRICVGVGWSGKKVSSARVGNGVIDGSTDVDVGEAVAAVAIGVGRWLRGATLRSTNPTQ